MAKYELMRIDMWRTNIQNQSRLASLVLPILEHGPRPVTEKFANEFTGALLQALLVEGDRGITFLEGLGVEQKQQVYEIFRQANADASVYISPTRRFRMSDLKTPTNKEPT